MLSPFGIFLVVYIIFIFFKKKSEDIIVSLVAITVFVETFVYYSYFTKIGGVLIRYHEFLILVLFLVMFVFLFKNKIDKKIARDGFFLLSAVILSNIFLIVNPLNHPIITYGQSWNDYFYSGQTGFPMYSFQTTLMTLRVLIFIVIAVSLIRFKNTNMLNKISDKFLKYGVFIIIYGLLEFLLKNIFQSDALYSINSLIFGIEGNPYVVRGGLVSIRGLMIEPAHFAEALFYYSVILIISNKPYIYKIRLIIVITILQFFSGSFTGAGLGIIATLLVLLLEKGNKRYLIFIFSLFTMLIFSSQNQLILNYYDRLLRSLQLLASPERNVISQTLTSEAIRIISVKETIYLFIKRPILGLGIGVTWGHGFLATMLVSVGSLGTYMWFKFFYSIARIKLSFSNYIVFAFVVLSWFLIGNMGTMYSMTTLMIALQFRVKNSKFITEKKEPQGVQKENNK